MLLAIDALILARCCLRQNMLFFSDRANYAFTHPRQGRIDMLMYYKDMRQPLAEASLRQFTFRVNRTLRHFADDYFADNPAHHLTLEFQSRNDFQTFESEILPIIEKAMPS